MNSNFRREYTFLEPAFRVVSHEYRHNAVPRVELTFSVYDDRANETNAELTLTGPDAAEWIQWSKRYDGVRFQVELCEAPKQVVKHFPDVLRVGVSSVAHAVEATAAA